MTFSIDQFITDCREAAVGENAFEATSEIMRQAVNDPAAVRAAISPPAELTYVGDMAIGFDKILFEDATVTVFLVDTEPGHLQPPHDHQMYALIGVYEGVERNRFFARENGGLKPAGEQNIEAGKVLRIHPSTIHAISASGSESCRALHVYLGGLSSIDRSLFDPQSGKEEPMTSDRYDGFIQRV